MYKLGNENRVVNALSQKLEVEREILAISITQIIGLEEIEKEISEDEKLKGIMQDLLMNPNSCEGYKL